MTCGRDGGAVLGGFGEDVAALRDAGGGAEGVAVGVAVAAGVGGDVLPGQDDAGRVLVVFQHDLPGRGDLVRVSGADDVQARDGAQGGELLHGLVGGAVLAQADRVVRPDIQGRDAHEGAEPDRGALVVGEDQERAGERPGPAVQGDAVHDRGRGVFADAEVQDPAVGVALPGPGGAGGRDERGRAFDRGVVGLGEVGGAAPEFGHDRADRVQDLAGRGAGGDVLAGLEDRQGGSSSTGSFLASTRSSRAAFSGLADCHASNAACQSVRAAAPRACAARVWARTSSSTWKARSGSKPRTFFRAATSSAPRAEPWILPVFCFFGAG